MRIIKIETLQNGGHANSIGDFDFIPKGFAVIPDNIETPNFPFGEIKVEEINGVMTVTKWIAGKIPESDEIEQPVSAIEQLRADIDYIAIMSGVTL